MDRGAWWATVHGVTRSWPWLGKWTHAHRTRMFSNKAMVGWEPEQGMPAEPECAMWVGRQRVSSSRQRLWRFVPSVTFPLQGPPWAEKPGMDRSSWHLHQAGSTIIVWLEELLPEASRTSREWALRKEGGRWGIHHLWPSLAYSWVLILIAGFLAPCPNTIKPRSSGEGDLGLEFQAWITHFIFFQP